MNSDTAHDALKFAGYSVGEVAGTTGWLVCGEDGAGDEICGIGQTQGEAWRKAAEQADAVPDGHSGVGQW